MISRGKKSKSEEDIEKQDNVSDSVISQTEINKWAQEDAQNDNATGFTERFPSFDGRLNLIVQTHTGTITQEFVETFQSRTDKLRNEFTDLAAQIVNDPKTFVDRVIAQINAAIAAADKQFAPKITSLQRELSEWEKRFKSGFHDGIANPKKQNIVWHWGIILFLLAVEVVLNSRFFAETSEFGLLGGTLAAVTVSVVNVGVPIIVAFFCHKMIYSKSQTFRVFGTLFATTAIAAVAILFNYEVAEYRERLLQIAERPPSSMPEYVALLAIGGGIAIISFWKMFSFMDPFTRPRRCHNNKEKAIANYTNAALKSVSDAQSQVAEAQEKIATLVDRTQNAIQRERANFEVKCAEAIRQSNAKIGYYHLKYCPVKADPDPPPPELDDSSYNFASAKKLVDDTIADLSDSCTKAQDTWRPLLDDTMQKLVETNKRFQAVVVAHIQAAVAKAD